MPKRILFVGHSASRTGAPIVLLHFLRWLRRNDDIQFDISMSSGGPLMPEFQAIAATETLKRSPALAGRVVRRIMGWDRWQRTEDRAFAERAKARGYDLMYVNTVVPKREICALSGSGIPVIMHVHEMEFAIHQWIGNPGLAPVIPFVTRFIAASNAVGDNLIRRWAIPESKISVVHSFLVDDVANHETSTARARLRSSLGLSDDDILVGTCGSLEWRKGSDLFVQMARLVAAAPGCGNVRFLWVGADRATLEYREFVQDIHAVGLEALVTVVESVSRPADYFAAMDIFALTSREDPFPLVMLEAASMELPLVCFAQSGGGPEFAEGDAGLVVPYLDVAEFARQVASLAGNSTLRRSIGGAAKRKVQEQYTIEQQAPKLRDIIMSVSK